MRKIFFFILILLSISLCNAQAYKTQPLSSEIHTIQINKAGNWLAPPIINLNSADYLQLSFDRISENSLDRLRYKVIHCNADWIPSSLSEIDYIDGFNDNLIDDYASSVNTMVEYTNFLLEIPNNDLKIRLSGNYVIIVYEADYPDNILLSACFSVVDSQISIEGNMTSNTLIDTNRGHQQISFAVNHQGMNIRDPFSDLKVFVRQNERSDNQKSLIKPTIIQNGRLLYEQNRNLIFEAGNEYRRFEIVSHRYNGLRVLHIEYKRPFYYAYIFPDMIRANKRYIYDKDQNGKFYLRNAEEEDSNTQGDYFFVEFTLKVDDPFLENIYINGNFTNNLFDDKYLMQYDYDKKEYYLSLMLKQGAYNYQYLAGQKNTFSTSLIEGNYYETENQYEIFVYYRPIGQRHDSLIGYLKIDK